MTTMINPAVSTAETAEPMSVRRVHAEACPAKRRKYSGNDVLRLIRVLEEAKLDMDRKCLSMNDVVHLVQDKLEGMLKTHKYSCAKLARLITMAGLPVTERTLKDYLAKARKDAKEGHTHYGELKEHILSQAGKEASKNCANDAATSLSSDDAPDAQNVSVAQDASDDFAAPSDEKPASAIPSAPADTEEDEKKKQHVQDIYAARKRRKKARTQKKADRLLIAQKSPARQPAL